MASHEEIEELEERDLWEIGKNLDRGSWVPRDL